MLHHKKTLRLVPMRQQSGYRESITAWSVEAYYSVQADPEANKAAQPL